MFKPLFLIFIIFYTTQILSAETFVEKVIADKKVKAGFCLLLGVTEAKDLISLAATNKFLVQSLMSDTAKVKLLRDSIVPKNIYGKISVVKGDLKKLPYADNLINLIVVRNLSSLIKKGLTFEDIIRVLAPNGFCYIESIEKSQADKLTSLTKKGDIASFSFVENIGLLISKKIPVGSDVWTHHNHAPDGNRVSKDTLAGPSQHLQWMGGVEWQMADYKTKAMVVGAGRVYYIVDESPIRRQPWLYLSARDAFSGILLWKKPFVTEPLTMIADNSRLLLKMGRNMVALNADTGKVEMTFKGSDNTSWALLQGRNLVTMNSKGLVCFNADTGVVVWKSEGLRVLTSKGMANAAAWNDKLFYVLKKSGVLGCIDVLTGKKIWTKQIEKELGGKFVNLNSCNKDLIVCSNNNGIYAFSTSDGNFVWKQTYEIIGTPSRRKAKSYLNGFFVNGKYWTLVGDIDPKATGKYKYLKGRVFSWQGLDLTSGKLKTRFDFPKGLKVGASCFQDQSTTKYFLGGYTDFIDTETGKHYPRAKGLHTSCSIGLRIAYGQMYNCALYMPQRFLQGDMSVIKSLPLKIIPPNDASRLIKGSAYKKNFKDELTDLDWPIYRQNNLRQSKTNNTVTKELKESWKLKLGKSISSPVCVGDQLFVACPDSHQIKSISIKNKKVLWTFTADAPIKATPTYFLGTCLFGSSDGWIYCLDAKTGVLAWKFNAAPANRRIVVRGHVTSPWPVDQGIICQDGIVYGYAGHHAQVDNGMHLYALDFKTGAIIYYKALNSMGTAKMLIVSKNSVSIESYKFRYGLKDINKRPSSNTSIPGSAYSKRHLDVAYILGKKVTAPFKLNGIVKSKDLILALGHLAGKNSSVQLIWKKSRASIAQYPSRHPLDKKGPVVDSLFIFSNEGVLEKEIKLKTSAVWDSLISSRGKIFVCTQDGILHCFE